MGVVKKRQLKGVITFRGDDFKKVVRFFSRGKRVSGDTISLPPRVTPTPGDATASQQQLEAFRKPKK